MEQSTLYLLDNLCLIDIIGKESLNLLQGQVTSDVKSVNELTGQRTVFCNLKGRIIAMATIIKQAHFGLILQKDMVPFLIPTLQKVAMLSRVNLKERPSTFLIGFIGKEIPEPFTINIEAIPLHSIMVTETFSFYKNGIHSGIFILSEQQWQALSIEFKNNLQNASLWEQQQLLQGQFDIYPETEGLFLPHRIDLHKTSVISFNKGCYKGQEIIARTHYKATIKHTLAFFTLDDTPEILRGERLLDPKTHAEVGQIIDFGVDETKTVIAVSILIEHPKEVVLEKSERLITLMEFISK